MIILRKPVTGLSETALASFVRRARSAARLKKPANILVTTDSELRKLNRRFRGKNRATDVLSFPASHDARDFAGDIAISAEIAACNAAKLGHTTAAEIKILALHGILHLAGYDHESDSGEMARKEERMRRHLGLPVGLIERNGTRAQASERKKKKRTSR